MSHNKTINTTGRSPSFGQTTTSAQDMPILSFISLNKTDSHTIGATTSDCRMTQGKLKALSSRRAPKRRSSTKENEACDSKRMRYLQLHNHPGAHVGDHSVDTVNTTPNIMSCNRDPIKPDDVNDVLSQYYASFHGPNVGFTLVNDLPSYTISSEFSNIESVGRAANTINFHSTANAW